MLKDNEPKTHVFFKPCGCLSSACVDVPNMYDELAKLFRYAKKHNEVYKFMNTEDVRKLNWKCEAHKVKSKEKIEQGGLL